MLKVQCLNLSSPKKQLSKFNETLESGFWTLVEGQDAKSEEDKTNRPTNWQREFDGAKKPKHIIKSTKNLLQRAAEYADVLELEAEITIEDNSPEIFSYQVDKPSDYFKTKSWK